MSGYLPSIQTCVQQVLNIYWQQSQVLVCVCVACICSIHAHACSCMWMSMCVWVYKHTYDRVPVWRQPWVLAFHLVWSVVTCLWSLCTRDWLVLGRIGFSCLHVPSQGGCTGITSVWFTVQLHGGARGSKLRSLALVWWQVLCLLPILLSP